MAIIELVGGTLCTVLGTWWACSVSVFICVFGFGFVFLWEEHLHEISVLNRPVSVQCSIVIYRHNAAQISTTSSCISEILCMLIGELLIGVFVLVLQL